MISRGAALSLPITGVKAGDGEEGQVRSRAAKEVLWTLLDGFKVADEPSKLNASRVGSGVYTRSGRSTAGS